MEVVVDSLSVDIDAFLSRPLCCFLAQRGDRGARVSPLWYLWEPNTEVCWIIAQFRDRSYPERVERHPESAVAVVDFAPREGRLEHVGLRGTASLAPWDDARADRLLRRYLGDERSAWDEAFRGLDGEDYGFIRMDPDTAVARGYSYATRLGGDEDN
ncbi:MAG: pyridoxamine 5'-phosphate oxidase family protein [Haloglomus sp.]